MYFDVSKVRAIDPPGCGCTECIIGLYVPFDSPYIDEVLEAAINGEIDVQSNMHGGSMIAYRANGRPQSSVVHGLTRRDEYLLVESRDEYYDDDEAVVIDVSKVEEIDDEEVKQETLTRIMSGDHVKNSTDSAFFIWNSWDGYQIEELYNYDSDTLTILWE